MKKGNVLKKTAAMILALSLLFPAELQAAQINAADTQTGTAAAAGQEVAEKLTYQAHVEDYGWMDWVAGRTG